MKRVGTLYEGNHMNDKPVLYHCVTVLDVYKDSRWPSRFHICPTEGSYIAGTKNGPQSPERPRLKVVMITHSFIEVSNTHVIQLDLHH